MYYFIILFVVHNSGIDVSNVFEEFDAGHVSIIMIYNVVYVMHILLLKGHNL